MGGGFERSLVGWNLLRSEVNCAGKKKCVANLHNFRSQSTSSTRPLQMNGLEDADWLDKVDGPISRAALLPPSQPLVQSKPFCDRRLERLDLSLWSEVEASNHFVASVISFYLVGELPMWGLFDADLFLDGLIGLPSPTCSPLLVNALLFWACVRPHALVPINLQG